MTARTCYRSDGNGALIFLNLPATVSDDNKGRSGILCSISHSIECVSQSQSYGVTVPSTGGCRSILKVFLGAFGPDFSCMLLFFYCRQPS